MKTNKSIAILAVAVSEAFAAFADFTPPEGDFDVLVYTRWRYVHNWKTGEAKPLLKFSSANVPEKDRKWARKNFKLGVIDPEHVLEWTKDYGKGRVFYTALGHNPKDFKKPEWLEHLLRAAEWTMRKGEAK